MSAFRFLYFLVLSVALLATQDGSGQAQEAQGQSQLLAKLQPSPQPQVRPLARPPIQAQPQVLPQIQQQVQAQVQPQVQAQAQPQVQAQVQPQLQAQVQPQVQAQVQPQVLPVDPQNANVDAAKIIPYIPGPSSETLLDFTVEDPFDNSPLAVLRRRMRKFHFRKVEPTDDYMKIFNGDRDRARQFAHSRLLEILAA